MEYSNCVKCGKMFLRVAGPVCADCLKEEEEQFMKVKHYLDDNPDKSIAVVAEGTGVSVKKILKFIKDGRLEMSPAISREGLIRCTKCGVPIAHGVYCEQCQLQYGQTVNELMAESARSKKMGMHSLPKAIDEKAPK